MFYKRLLTLAITLLSLNLIPFLVSQSPEDRCVTLGGTGEVCNNCYETLNCATNKTKSCGGDEICDMNIADGLCFSPTSSSVSPNCSCAETGCIQDPNNEEYIIQCNKTDDLGNPSIGLPICTATQTLNNDICECEAATCPECRFYSANTTASCSDFFLYCNMDGFLSDPMPCATGLCFNETTCDCELPYVPCPACNAYLDPDGTDGTRYCICGDHIETKCVTCDSGETFDEDTCRCTNMAKSSFLDALFKILNYN